MIEVALLAGFAGVTALVLARTWPEATKTWFRRILRFRKIVGSISGIVLGLVFLGTGVDFLVLAGFAIMVYSSLYLLYERPHSVISEWIPI